MQKPIETDRKFLNFNSIWICVTELEKDNFFPLKKTHKILTNESSSVFSVNKDKDP